MSRQRFGDRCCGSSVVEHSLGKGEVESSILFRSTIYFTHKIEVFCSIEHLSATLRIVSVELPVSLVNAQICLQVRVGRKFNPYPH